MGEEERVNSLWNYLLRNREPFSSPNKVLFQFSSFSKEGETFVPLREWHLIQLSICLNSFTTLVMYIFLLEDSTQRAPGKPQPYLVGE